MQYKFFRLRQQLCKDDYWNIQTARFVIISQFPGYIWKYTKYTWANYRIKDSINRNITMVKYLKSKKHLVKSEQNKEAQ